MVATTLPERGGKKEKLLWSAKRWTRMILDSKKEIKKHKKIKMEFIYLFIYNIIIIRYYWFIFVQKNNKIIIITFLEGEGGGKGIFWEKNGGKSESRSEKKWENDGWFWNKE